VSRSADFNPKNVEQDLGRLLKGKFEQAICACRTTIANSSLTAPSDPSSCRNRRAAAELALTAALPPLAALMSHLCLLSNPQNFGAFSVRTHDLAQYMKLDASALAALNLLPAPNGAGGKYGSLFGLLNRCKTAQGTRLLRVWLKQPLVNLWEIEKRQQLVEMFVEDTETRAALQARPPLMNELYPAAADQVFLRAS
jgi:DNA mismatch repair ATPase MutS